MSKRVTRLRPKNGAYFELDDDGHLTFRTPLGVVLGDSIEQSAVEGCIEFDVVVPEYQVGDLVAVKDSSFSKINYKGLVCSLNADSLFVAVEGKDIIIEFRKRRLANGTLEIVGLWSDDLNES